MRPLIRLWFFLALMIAAPAFAGPIETANAAVQRGDYAAAEQILLPIAEEGNPYAQYRLGLVYAEAPGELRSVAEAAKWFEWAALQGQPYAQYKLGMLYVKGDGVSRDYVMAYLWFSLSARHAGGNAEAARQRDMLAPRMTTGQVDEAKRQVRNWRPVRPEPLQPTR